jgi:NADH-quinone oxidoreductase subunit M
MSLIILIIIPFIAALFSWFFGNLNKTVSRLVALGGLITDALIVAIIWLSPHENTQVWLAQVKHDWIPQLGISFHLALDGLSLVLIALTIFLGIISVIISWTEIQDAVGFFHFNLMVIISGLIGVFLALDLILFYFFWEVMLVPMYFLIAIWGHENRVFAALKFFIFTQVGSLFMLFSIVGLYYLNLKATNVPSFDYFQFLKLSISPGLSLLLSLGFIAAFAVKLPVFLVHTWLPDAHTEAPTAGSVILAGLLLKTGGYGFFRFVLPLFPDASQTLAPAAMLLGVLGIIYGAAMAFAQTDLKRLVAYSSVSHLGFVLIGIFTFREIAMQGAVAQMVAHGFSTGALFVIVGMLQERTHTRDMNRIGGLWLVIPVIAGFALFFALASLGLPGTGNFTGEFLILLGTFQVSSAITFFAATGLIFSAIYSLYMIYRVFYGEIKFQATLLDLSARETATLFVLAIAVLWLGFHPQTVLDKTRNSVITVEKRIGASYSYFETHMTTLSAKATLLWRSE